MGRLANLPELVEWEAALLEVMNQYKNKRHKPQFRHATETHSIIRAWRIVMQWHEEEQRQEH